MTCSIGSTGSTLVVTYATSTLAVTSATSTLVLNREAFLSAWVISVGLAVESDSEQVTSS